MSLNKYALIRYRAIDQCLSKKFNSYPSKEELRDACEEALYGSQEGRISIYTIDKDLNAMRNDTVLGYEAPIAYSKIHKGYFYTDSNYTIKKLPVSEDGLDALTFAAHTLYQFRDTPVFKQYEEVIGKIRDSLTMGQGELDGSYLDHMMFEDTTDYTGTVHLTTILKAIKEKVKIKFSYQAFQSDIEKKYTLAPYLLKEFDKRWYVIGLDTIEDKVKTFGLERLSDLSVTEEYFLRSKTFSSKAYFNDTIGISNYGLKPQKIVLQVDKLQSKYLMSRPMHHSLKIVKEGKEIVTLSLNVILSYELVNEIMAWTPYVEVIKPAELKEMVLDRLKKINKKYRL